MRVHAARRVWFDGAQRDGDHRHAERDVPIPAAGASLCEWKGRAAYWPVRGPDTAIAAAGIKVLPQPGRFYGGWVTPEITGPFKREPGSEAWQGACLIWPGLRLRGVAWPFNPTQSMYRPAPRFSVAPMMEWTDRHCRMLHRLLTRRAWLYTEMVTAEAVIRGDRARLLGYSAAEHPLALQLGGSEPARLAEAARIGADFGYDEINLNAGCPSDRVQSGRFGACLMAEPELVADCVAAMRAAVPIPVTVKCRLGIDEQDPEVALRALIGACRRAGVTHFIIHARKAWLKGLSPKENRDIPPLDYALVHRIKTENPALMIELNGGLQTLEAALPHLAGLDGVMLGRAAYHNPALLARVDAGLNGEAPIAIDAVIEAWCAYIGAELGKGTPLNAMTKHMLGLFNGRPGARLFRRHLSGNATKPGAGIATLREALTYIGAPHRVAA